MPQTTKTTPYMHGFGMVSIQRFCEKYAGDLKVFAKDQVFSIEIFLPAQ
jgi:sensor histidine kinase regulating citrate/malate metabolism